MQILVYGSVEVGWIKFKDKNFACHSLREYLPTECFIFLFLVFTIPLARLCSGAVETKGHGKERKPKLKFRTKKCIYIVM